MLASWCRDEVSEVVKFIAIVFSILKLFKSDIERTETALNPIVHKLQNICTFLLKNVVIYFILSVEKTTIYFKTEPKESYY